MKPTQAKNQQFKKALMNQTQTSRDTILNEEINIPVKNLDVDLNDVKLTTKRSKKQ
jgi:hypothetical protein